MSWSRRLTVSSVLSESYLVPVSIIDGVRHAARNVSMAQIITQTRLSIFDLGTEATFQY